jgi:hypothetical protein
LPIGHGVGKACTGGSGDASVGSINVGAGASVGSINGAGAINVGAGASVGSINGAGASVGSINGAGAINVGPGAGASAGASASAGVGAIDSAGDVSAGAGASMDKRDKSFFSCNDFVRLPKNKKPVVVDIRNSIDNNTKTTTTIIELTQDF